ncbi:hypothetical protein BDV19DRAFT_380817 [Aspergillus venezuelensis]
MPPIQLHTPDEIRTAAAALANALTLNTRYTVVGGGACAVLGSDRMTEDIDFVVLRGQTPAARQLLRSSPVFNVEARTNHTTYKVGDSPHRVITIGNIKVLKPALILNSKCRSIQGRHNIAKRGTDFQDIAFLLTYCAQNPQFLPRASEVPNATKEFVQSVISTFQMGELWTNAGYDLDAAFGSDGENRGQREEITAMKRSL